MVTVINLGGSIVAPATGIDPQFLAGLRDALDDYLSENDERRLVIVVGGGVLARTYQKAAKDVVGDITDSALDWVGIWATRANAQLVHAVLQHRCTDPVVLDPSSPPAFTGRVLLAGGWKPGFSTDNVAVMLAEAFGARRVISLSNIEKVYTADPERDPAAKPIDRMSWDEYRKMVGDLWQPGKNTPFDPVASRRAQELGLEVVNASGTNIENLEALLRGRDFIGTTIAPP
jgi:uridylate kinase